jgi:hypothetical protein
MIHLGGSNVFASINYSEFRGLYTILLHTGDIFGVKLNGLTVTTASKSSKNAAYRDVKLLS